MFGSGNFQKCTQAIYSKHVITSTKMMLFIEKDWQGYHKPESSRGLPLWMTILHFKRSIIQTFMVTFLRMTCWRIALFFGKYVRALKIPAETRVSVVACIKANEHPNSHIPFFTSIDTLFTSNNAILTTTTQAHFFTLFNRKKPPKSRYRKQPTHFSMTPLRHKLKKKFSKSENL